jgi:hypothetical protein
MGMETIQLYRWILKSDPEATRKAYAALLRGWPEECGCKSCQNFIAARKFVYPAEALALFDRLGIAYNREAESYHNGRLESGLHSYGGWFHFVGTIEGGENNFEMVGEHFSISFSTHTTLIPRAFGEQPVVQLEFQTEVPWVIEGAEEE